MAETDILARNIEAEIMRAAGGAIHGDDGRVNWAKVIGEMLAETEIRRRRQVAELEARLAKLEARAVVSA